MQCSIICFTEYAIISSFKYCEHLAITSTYMHAFQETCNRLKLQEPISSDLQLFQTPHTYSNHSSNTFKLHVSIFTRSTIFSAHKPLSNHLKSVHSLCIYFELSATVSSDVSNDMDHFKLYMSTLYNLQLFHLLGTFPLRLAIISSSIQIYLTICCHLKI